MSPAVKQEWGTRIDAHVAQLVERILGKDEVIGPIPIVGSILISLDIFKKHIGCGALGPVGWSPIKKDYRNG